MKTSLNILCAAAAALLCGCAKEEKSESAELEQITLSATFSTSPSTEIKPEHQTESRATATAFESGDELGLFVVKSGMEVQKDGNLVNNHKMIVGSDGVIKGTPTAVYYPTSSKQTTSPTSQVTIHSYYPYQSGDATADALGVLVGIRTDQTDFSDVKRSDLCYGSLDNVEPSKSAKVITFKHSFAQVRINVSLYNGCPAIKQLRLINVKDSATLNMQTGAISLKSHTAEVLAYKSAENSYSTIIPAQTFSGACVAIDLVDNKTTYIYNAIDPISLTQSATNTLNITINDKGVASLNGTPSVTAWTTATSSGMMNSAINNQISLYWLAPHSDYATADKITLSTIDPLGVTREIDLLPTVDPASSADYAVYKFDLKIDSVTYPLTINKVQIYKSTNLLSECPDVTLVGKVLYKVGAHVLAIDANRAGVRINNLIWAPGNLVADGINGARIGAPTDGGLYFQFGSLIGWKGGATGNGVGRPVKATGTYYDGTSFDASKEVAVTPREFTSITNIGTTWPNQTTNLYYFGLQTPPYATAGTNIQDYPGFLTGSLASSGVGDPCRYYLKDNWRLPTSAEYQAMHNAATSRTYPGDWVNLSTNSYLSYTFSSGAELKFSPVGCRNNVSGYMYSIGDGGWCWPSSIYSSSVGYLFHFSVGNTYPQHNTDRRSGSPIRCVKDIPTEPQTPTANDYITINDLKWAKGNLVAVGGQNAKVGQPGDGGLYFQYGSLIGYKGGANGDGTGICNATTHPNGKWWGGTSAYSTADVAVAPANYASKATWPYFNNVASGGYGYYYYNTFVAKYMDFQSQSNGKDVALGVGDPCAHYLGGSWRLPIYCDFAVITGAPVEGVWVQWTNDLITGQWTASGPPSNTTIGAWFGPNSRTGTPTTATDLFVPASGNRNNSNGAFYWVGMYGYLWSSSVYDYYRGFLLYINESNGVLSRYRYSRAYGFPVRCVEGISVGTAPGGNLLGAAYGGDSRDIVVTVGGASNWTASATGTGLSISPTSGKSGDKITVTWAPNVANSERKGSVKIVVVGSSKSITIQASQAPQYIVLNGLKWTTGNLVADGANGARIGSPGDGGLYFQYGGLIGYKGGANGDGTGILNTTTNASGKWWNGAAAYSEDDVAVAPAGYATKATWPVFSNVASGGFGYYYFNTLTTKYADFQGQANANNPTLGIGDPCTHYLGSPWRLPKFYELTAIICGSVPVEEAWVPWTDGTVKGRWASWGPQSAVGAWFGPNARTDIPTVNTDLFIPASGDRHYSNGAFTSLNYGYLLSSSVYDYYRGLFVSVRESEGVMMGSPGSRGYGFPVRCVSN